jgi:ADP-ribose pyrophosphatase YjhB (NUDIX family)
MNDWLARILRLKAIAETGKAYGNDRYDLLRYAELEQLAVDMLSDLTSAPPAQIGTAFEFNTGYPTPKVDVRAGVFHHGRVLLVREKADGLWSLPGGWADQTDAAAETAERETLEEAGCRVRAIKLAAVKDRRKHPYTNPMLQGVYKFLFVCDLIERPPENLRTVSAARDDVEIHEADFFNLTDLPPLSEGRTLTADVELLWQHQTQPELPTFFDAGVVR